MNKDDLIQLRSLLTELQNNCRIVTPEAYISLMAIAITIGLVNTLIGRLE